MPLVDAPAVSYDRIDWHLDSAVEAGQPEEHAFAHIGLYLAWLIRHDLHDPRMFPSEHIDAVKSGEMTGSDLGDDIDGKLVADVMSPEGRAFSDASYDAYLDEYAKSFDDLPEYGVVDGPDAYSKVEAVLDRLYAEWVADERQAPSPKPVPGQIADDFPLTQSIVMVPPGLGRDAIDDLLKDLPPGSVQVISPEDMPIPHEGPDLEALIPDDLMKTRHDRSSVRATHWGSSLLNRALKRLGIRPADAVVVSAMGESSHGSLTVMLYNIPGIDAARLMDEFGSVIFRIPGSTWESRTIAGHHVQWAAAEEFTVAFWARDGLVIHVAGEPSAVEYAISRLP